MLSSIRNTIVYEPIKVLVIGSGGREHALCWKLAQSPLVRRLYCAPGNGGTDLVAKTENVAIAVDDSHALTQFAVTNKIDLVVVGPDNPLANGIVDIMEGCGLRVFGPNKAAARLEWSKAYAKEVMKAAGIPTARFYTCDSYDSGAEHVKQNSWARVVKVDGLALGKGVYVCDSEEETLEALAEVFASRRFGDAGNCVVLEERLAGEEISLLTFCDGKRLVPMPPCQDHKRRFAGDKGANTGGMGAFSPVDLYESCKNEISSQVLVPLERALNDGTLFYKGILYIGLMMVPGECTQAQKYNPYVLEFNARFGDPETQALLPRLRSDLLPVLWACTEGTLDETRLEWSTDVSCCVVAVTQSYPGASSKGDDIVLGALPPGTTLFHSGTALVNGKLQTAGGRILSVTGMAPSMEVAVHNAYLGLRAVSFANMDFRCDIARRAKAQCRSN